MRGDGPTAAIRLAIAGFWIQPTPKTMAGRLANLRTPEEAMADNS